MTWDLWPRWCFSSYHEGTGMLNFTERHHCYRSLYTNLESTIHSGNNCPPLFSSALNSVYQRLVYLCVDATHICCTICNRALSPLLLGLCRALLLAVYQEGRGCKEAIVRRSSNMMVPRNLPARHQHDSVYRRTVHIQSVQTRTPDTAIPVCTVWTKLSVLAFFGTEFILLHRRFGTKDLEGSAFVCSPFRVFNRRGDLNFWSPNFEGSSSGKGGSWSSVPSCSLLRTAGRGYKYSSRIFILSFSFLFRAPNGS